MLCSRSESGRISGHAALQLGDLSLQLQLLLSHGHNNTLHFRMTSLS